MRYILKGKNPIPCDDDDLWKAWYTKENYLINKYVGEDLIVTAKFTGKPLKMTEEQKGPLLFFQVTAVFRDEKKLAEFSFYSTWEEAENRYKVYVASSYLRQALQ